MNIKNKNFSKSTVISFIVTLFLSFAIIFIIIYYRAEKEKLQMEQLILEKSTLINEKIVNLIGKTDALAIMTRNHDEDFENFYELAPFLLDDPAILNFIMAPDGIVKHIYTPYDNGSNVIGLNYFEPGAGNREALMAIELRQTVMGGPFLAVQGGYVLAGRKAVFLDKPEGGEDFWGIVSVTLKFPEVIESVRLGYYGNLDYAYELWRVNPDNGQKQVIAGSENEIKKTASSIVRHLPILQADWHLEIIYGGAWYSYYENWILFGFGLFISFFFLFLLHKNDHFNSMKSKVMEEERILLMLDSSPICCQIWNKDIKLIDCNEAAVKLYGLSSKQEYTERFFELSPAYQPDGQRSSDKIIALVKKAYSGKNIVFEWLHLHPDGTLIPTEITLVSVHYGGENVVLGYTRDLRKQEELMKNIRAQGDILEMRLGQHELMNSISKNIILPGHNDNNLDNCLALLGDYFNATQILLFRFDHVTKETVLTYSWTINKMPVMFGNFDLYDSFNDLYADIPSDENTTVTTCSDLKDISREAYDVLAEYGVTALLIAPIYIDGKLWGSINIEKYGTDARDWNQYEKEFMVMISNTISVILLREIYDKKLSIALDQALAASKSKSSFLANMSHEIRTPLNAILGMTEIQLQKEMLPSNIEEAFNIVYDSAKLLGNIINDILDFSNIEVGKIEFTYSEYDLTDLLNDTTKLIHLRYESKPIKFELKADKNTPLRLFGDELRVKQILSNILSNAFKYTDKGSVILEVFSADNKDDGNLPKPTKDIKLIFRITDTGQGMSKEDLTTIFEEYARFNTKKNSSIAGAGLGMSISKRLIDLMDGEIKIDSEPDKGSVFTIIIPQTRVGTAVIGPAFDKSYKSDGPEYHLKSNKIQFIREYMPYGKVLIVDDIETNLYVAKGLLIPYGLVIETSASGFDAIEKVKNGNIYDIIFMDHMMPQLDGMETAKFLRETGYTSPIVALTANAAAGQAEVFLHNGFNAFIAKPIDMNELNIVLNELIRDKQPLEIIEAARRKNKETVVPAEKIYALPEAIIAAFLRDAKKSLAVLDILYAKLEFKDERDIQLYITSVHSMKNALEIIGEKDLSVFTADLEQAGRERNIDVLLKNTPTLLNNIRSLISRINVNEVVEDIGDLDVDGDFLAKQMNIIKAECDDYDKKAIKESLTLLKEKTWSKQIENNLNAINTYLLHSDFRKIADIADEIINKIGTL